MTWSADLGTRVDALITQIATRLTASGWTLTDRTADGVWHATNNQGVTQYIQITEGGAYQYLQFQGWKSWDVGTHAGANGSGTTVNRLYYASANVAAATLVDLYMSVTANRFIIFIKGVGNYNNWAYFGGLDALAGIADPLCVYLIAAYATTGANANTGMILQSYSTGAYWVNGLGIIPVSASTSDSPALTPVQNAMLAVDPTQIMAFPILISENLSPFLVRGNLDGLLYVPGLINSVSTLDTIAIGGVTHLVFQPGGQTTANTHPITGNYSNCLAVAEV